MEYSLLIFGTIVTFVMTYFSYSKNRDENERNNLSNKNDNILFFVFIAGLLVTLISGLNTIWDNIDNKQAIKISEQEKIDREVTYQKTLDSSLKARDSIHEHKDSLLKIDYGNKVDSSYAKSIKTSNTALAKYNLVMIDSMDRVVSKINIKAINLPQFLVETASPGALSPIYITTIGNKKKLQIKVKSINNVSYNIKFGICVFESTESDIEFDKIKFLTCAPFGDRDFLTTNVVSTVTGEVDPVWSNLQRVYIVLSGTFSSDQEEKKIIPYHQGFVFNILKNQLDYTLSKENLDQLLKIIDQKK